MGNQMDMEQAKQLAELEKLKAEARKTRLEAAKIKLDGRKDRRLCTPERVIAYGSAIGGLIMAALGMLAALTENRIAAVKVAEAEMKREVVALQTEKAEKELDEKTAQIEDNNSILTSQSLELQKKSEDIRVAEENLGKLQAQVDELGKKAVAAGSEVVSEEVVTELAAVSQSIAQAASVLSQSSEAGMPRLYIYYASAEQQALAETIGLAQSLTRCGFDLGRTSAGRGRAPHTTEVRFFRPANRSQATQILECLRSVAGFSGGRVSYVIDPDSDRVSTTFHIWLAEDALQP